MAFTVDECRERLAIWLEAEAKIAINQSYSLENRRFDRANLAQVRDQIKFWRSELALAEMREYGRSRRRVIRVVPRDL
ncbi:MULTISPECIES: DUF6148 family protein [Lysinibacillus]|uniref:DUF6148 family protein n=1 Tax=Lysinibacillus TaxID=400634 RepID=UPI00042ED745|nr:MULTISPECIES: DUF6148 family protein [Lysinibacillus]AHN22080.1 hypothetical protein T479_12530 [Lysinibacillus varians]